MKHSILHSFAPKYEIYGNIEILNRKYQITTTIVEDDHKPTDAFNLDVNQKNSVSVIYESDQRYSINTVAKSSTNIMDDFSVTDPYYRTIMSVLKLWMRIILLNFLRWGWMERIRFIIVNLYQFGKLWI